MSEEKAGMPVFLIHSPETAAEKGMTSEQRAAVETGGGQLLVSASAGSGKTSVLTRRVVRRILEGTRADEMLIVTFTNAAAREMRVRVAAELKKEHDRCTDADRKKELRRQLTLLPQARICTMDSFCGEFVRMNFQRLGVSPDYRIVLGPEFTLLRRSVLSSVFDELYAAADEGFVACVDAFSSSRDDEGLFELVLELLDSLESEPYPEKTLERLEEDFDPNGKNGTLEKSAWYAVICERLADKLEPYIAIFERARLWAKSHSTELGDKIVSQRCDELYQLQETLQKLQSGIIPPPLSFGVQSSLRQGNKNFRFYDVLKDILGDSRKEVKNILKCNLPSRQEYSLQLELCSRLMHTLSGIVRRYYEVEREFKHRRNILTFSDTSHLTLSLLTDGYDESTDTLTLSEYAREYSAGRWGRPVSEVMIDEYQDTNLLQSLIFRALSEDGKRLFCVGDLKQSIYRFRQARPDLFAGELERFSRVDGEFPQVRFLTRNFRSSKGVLGFVNLFFAHIMSRKTGGADYDDTQWAYAGATFPDNDYDTELLLMDKNDPGWAGLADADNVGDENDGTSESASEANDDYNNGLVCARRINELIASGRKVFNAKTGESRDISYDDFVLLLRAAKGHVDSVARALSDSGIPVYSNKAQSYLDRYEVRFVLAFLRAVDNPYLDIPLAAALRSPIFCFTAQELCDLRESGGGCLYDRLKASDEPKAKAAFETLARYRSASRGEPVYRLIWNMYSEFSLFSAVGAMSAPEQRAENLRLIYRHACSYEDSALRGLYGFLCYMERVEEQQKDDAGENPAPATPHVTISTIHGVKGLEYPFVFLLKADSTKAAVRHGEFKYSPRLGAGMHIRDRARRIEFDTFALTGILNDEANEELSELLRALYVAFTRAKEKLFIVGKIGLSLGDAKDVEIMKLISRFCMMQDGLQRPISAADVRDCGSALELVLMALLRHPDARTQIARLVGQLPHSISNEDNDILLRSTMSDRFAGDGGAPGIVLRVCPPVPACTGKAPAVQQQSSPVDISMLDYAYSDAALSGVPAKVSVSDLKGLREMDEDSGIMTARRGAYDKPAFVRGALTAAQRGTAVHKFVQYIVFGDRDIRAQLKRMVSRGTLTEEEAQAVNVPALERFTESGLYARIAASGRVEREYRFLTQVPASQYDPRLAGAAAQRRIMLQGVIDLFFAEEDGLTLVDYKTDRSTDEAYYREHYALQLNLYAQALEGLTGERVVRRVVYSFSAGKEIEL